MIQKTRKKLTLIYWSMSAILFIAILAVFIYMNYKKAVQGEEYFFESRINLIAQQVAYTRDLQPDFFQHLQDRNQLYVYSQTEHKWYSSPQSEDGKDKLQKAVTDFMAQPENQTYSIISYLPFNLEYSSTNTSFQHSYFGIQVEFETINHNKNTLLIFYDVSGKFISTGELVIYFFTGLSGLLILLLLCRFFVLLATKPVVQGIQQQNEFIASASHELKSPIAVIQLNAETIPTVDPETGTHLLNTIIEQCHHLTKLIQNMLLLASSDAHHFTVKPEAIEIDHFFISIFEQYYPYCLQHGHQLSLTLEDTLPQKIQGDKTLLTQVMGILIDNAVSYSIPDSPIHLSVSPVHGTLKVSLENQSPLLTDEQKEKLFNRFYQVDSSQSAPNHSGLGLSIAKEIIEAHHGQIYLESTQNDLFIITFRIPL